MRIARKGTKTERRGGRPVKYENGAPGGEAPESATNGAPEGGRKCEKAFLVWARHSISRAVAVIAMYMHV